MRRTRYRDNQYYRGRGRGGGGGGGCARDACLLETGCCVAEALDGNCLIAGIMLLPQMFATSVRSTARSQARRDATSPLVAAIRLYQREISAHRDPVCRYTPSCSNYAIEAINTHGPVRGSVMAARRIVRCRPGAARGADPVPAPA